MNKKLPPLTTKELTQLRTDSADIVSTAKRKDFTLDSWDLRNESEAAKNHFDLGCWLYYYRNKISQPDSDGFKARVDCMWRIFNEGLDRINPGYRFFTVFEFGERQFDTLGEMGDAHEVIDAVRDRYVAAPNANVQKAFAYMGWPIEKQGPNLSLF